MNETDTDVLVVRRDGAVCRALLNRPQVGNALSSGLVEALTDLVAECGADGTAQLVLEGAGRHFCTGVDLSSLDDETDDTLLARFVRIELLLQALHNATFDTVALAHGRVAGAGADLFVACRQRLVRADTKFAFPGAAGFGLILGTRRLAALVGQETARRWIHGAEWINTATALSCGLATAQADTPVAPLSSPDPQTVRALRLAMQGSGADEHDLALLTRSAARPGLKERIIRYSRRQGVGRKPG